MKARADGPVLIHAVTKKGKGYAPAESSADRGHARARFDVVTGEQARRAIDAGVCAIGAFLDEALNAVLGVDGETEFALYAAALGKKAEK